jgi:antirestriction protein ArdC
MEGGLQREQTTFVARQRHAKRFRNQTDHASYLQSWLKVLSDDKRAIFQAAAHA